MDIRQAVFADTLQLSSLCMEVQRLHAEHHPDVFQIPESEDFAISFFEEMLADPAVRIFIAEEDGESVGYILCKLVERPVNPFTFAARSLHVDQISVRPGMVWDWRSCSRLKCWQRSGIYKGFSSIRGVSISMHMHSLNVWDFRNSIFASGESYRESKSP